MPNGEESTSLRKLTITLSGGLDVTGRDRDRLVDGGPMLRDMRNVMISKGHIVPMPELLESQDIGMHDSLVPWPWISTDFDLDGYTPEEGEHEWAYQYGSQAGEIPVWIDHLIVPGQFEETLPEVPAPNGGINSDGFRQKLLRVVVTSKNAYTYWGKIGNPRDDLWNQANLNLFGRTSGATLTVTNGSDIVSCSGSLFHTLVTIPDRASVAGGWIFQKVDVGGDIHVHEVMEILTDHQLRIDRPYTGPNDTDLWFGAGGNFQYRGAGGAYMNEFSHRVVATTDASLQFLYNGPTGTRPATVYWAGRAAGGGQQIFQPFSGPQRLTGGYNTAILAADLDQDLSYACIVFSRYPHEHDSPPASGNPGHDYDPQLFDINGIEVLPSGQVMIGGSALIDENFSPIYGLYYSRLWHSDIGRAYLWNNAAGTGGALDLITHRGALLAFKKFGNQYTAHFPQGIAVGYFTGDPYQPVEWRETFADVGALCPRTILTIGGNQFFLGTDYRCHFFDGQRTRPITESPIEALVKFPVNELRYSASAVYDNVNEQVWLLVSPYSKTRADTASDNNRGKSFVLVWDIKRDQWSRPIDTDWVVGCLSAPYRDYDIDDWVMAMGISSASLSGAPAQPSSMYQAMRLVDSSWWASPYRFVSQRRQQFHRASNESSFTLSALDFQEVDVKKVIDHIDVYFARFYLPADDDMTVELRVNINGDLENYVNDTKTLTETENTSTDQEAIVRFFFDAEGFEQATLTTILEGDKTDFNISGAIEKYVIYYQVLSEDQVAN
jgi:hypothetical protein